MRLADDERGRVPFALIGVLLLASSVAIATVQFDRDHIDRDATLAGDRAEAVAETALRDAVRDAGERAAANPVVSSAENKYGAILKDTRPYRSYLELLVAIELRQRLEGTSQRVGDATARVELPPIEGSDSAAAAIQGVTIEPSGRGRVEATVDEVPIVVRRNGAVVSERTRTLSLTVTTPALTLHERATTFQSRLNTDSLRPGTLNRGLAGGLWSLAWARGYAQYAGVPFENVIDNAHVELVTNQAVLDVQRSVFGHSDEQGERALARETMAVIANEGIGMASRTFQQAALPTDTNVAFSAPTVESPNPKPREVGVDKTADLALADLLASRASPDGKIIPKGAGDIRNPLTGNRLPMSRYSERALVRTAASIDARLRTETRRHPARLTSRSPVPESEWTRIGVDSRSGLEATSTAGSAPTPSAGSGWSIARTAERTVELTWTETVAYRNGSSGRVRYVEERYRRRVDVGIALVDRPVQRAWIPDAAAPEPESDLYRSLRTRAARQLLADQGGVDGIAEAEAKGKGIETSAVATPEDVGSLADTAYGEVADTRDRLRDVSTMASPGHALTDEQRPVAELASRIRRQSASYRGVPRRYDGLGHRATVALRSVYVDRVLARLDHRTKGSSAARQDISNKVNELSQISGAGLGDFFEIGMDYSRPRTTELDARDPAPNLTVTIDGDPSYLQTDTAVETAVPAPGDGKTYHPMGARTMTVSSLPTSEITSAITKAITSVFSDSEETIPLTAAAQTLSSGRLAKSSDVETALSEDDIDNLHKDVGEEVDQFVVKLAKPLAAETDLSEGEARIVVKRTFLEIGGSDRMGLDAQFKKRGTPEAIVESTETGYLTAKIADRARTKHDVPAVEADRAQTRMRAARERYLAKSDTQIPVHKVEKVGKPTRKIISDVVGTGVDRVDQRATDALKQRIRSKTRFSVLPTRGFPVAPVPPWWYVTANVWHVDVHGTYAGFTVRADQGGPSGGGQVSYVRDGQAVHLDVDGDGIPEKLGTSDRIRFYATSTVAVVVPRGGGGVGNEGSGFLERTKGWDPTRAEQNACSERPVAPSGATFDVCRMDGGLAVDRDGG